MTEENNWIIPDWDAPAHVRALVTTRRSLCRGSSSGPYADFNLADHVGDDPQAVANNRRSLCRHLPSEPVWLRQVHGTHVLVTNGGTPQNIEADASLTRLPGSVCAVLTADCLPLLLCNESGTVAAAAHAGWRGLANGVIEAVIAAMAKPGPDLLVWLGPAIGSTAFEVGEDVRAAFLAHDANAASAFAPTEAGKWLCDIYELARQRLAALGVARVYGGNFCTYSDPARFYSFRRDGDTGRMASMIWLAP